MDKGIILAGGSGSRLFPSTKNTSKQLLPVYDKPMIYYPLSTLMLGGVREIALISTPRDLNGFKELLGNGHHLGIKITYFIQEVPKGLAEAFIICKDFIGDDSTSLILGDNIFYGNMRLKEVFKNFEKGALIFGYPVDDPERYGIVEFDESGKVVSLEEKPSYPKSRFAIPGLYLYDNKVVSFAEELSPSKRGELEITDLNKKYLEYNKLKVNILGRGIAWLDTGTSNSLQDAGSFVQTIEKRQSYKIGCIEEVALRMNFIDPSEFEIIISNTPDSSYKKYLISVGKDFT